jgi:hypothetical protein
VYRPWGSIKLCVTMHVIKLSFVEIYFHKLLSSVSFYMDIYYDDK